jgi:O-antigen ligase
LWTCLSLAWSPELGWGLEELRAFRSFLIPISLFPVILHYNRILSAFLIAIAIINLIQIAQSLGIAWIDPVRPNRYCAWIAPNPGGLLLAAAFVAHIAWFILDCRRGRAVLHIGGGVLAAIGLLLMVNRGAIVAVGVGAIVILAAGIILLPRARVAVLLAAIAMTIGMAMGLLLDNVAFDGRITAPMRRQAQSGFDDLANSDKFVGRPIYRRSVMYRVEVWKAALEAIGQRPIVGIGVGGVWHAFDAHPEFTANDRTAVDYIPVDGDHRHVHNTWLFIAVTTGLIGSLLMVLTIGSGLVAEARRAAASHPIAFVGFGIVVTWMVGNVFDTLIISGSTSCLLILGLLPAWIPRSQD